MVRALQREWFYTPLSLRKDGSLREVAFCLCDGRPEHITIEKTKGGGGCGFYSFMYPVIQPLLAAAAFAISFNLIKHF